MRTIKPLWRSLRRTLIDVSGWRTSFLMGVNGGRRDLALDFLRLLVHFAWFVGWAGHMSDQLFYFSPFLKENVAVFYAYRVIFCFFQSMIVSNAFLPWLAFILLDDCRPSPSPFQRHHGPLRQRTGLQIIRFLLPFRGHRKKSNQCSY